MSYKWVLAFDCLQYVTVTTEYEDYNEALSLAQEKVSDFNFPDQGLKIEVSEIDYPVTMECVGEEDEDEDEDW